MSYLAPLVLFLLTVGAYAFFKSDFKISQLVHWDARHYLSISQNGYHGFTVAFFPLFPLLLKLVGTGILSSITLNTAVFLLSFYFLFRSKKMDVMTGLILLTVPFNLFYFLPFSESVFFASSALLLFGIERNKKSATLLGLFFLGISRPVFIIVLPALILAEFASESKKSALKNCFLYLVTSTLSLLTVAIIQFLDTDKWFEFFSVQSGWGNQLQLPNFPLTTWGGDFVLRLDAAALLIGTISGIICLLLVFHKKRAVDHSTKSLIVATAYLTGISLFVLFMRGGSLFSLNRFVFATPFFLYGLYYWIQSPLRFSNVQLLTIGISFVLFSGLFGSYVHIQTLLLFLLTFACLMLLFLLKAKNKRIASTARYMAISANCTLFIVLVWRYIDGGWIA